MAHAYLLSARAMSRLVDAAQVSEPLRVINFAGAQSMRSSPSWKAPAATEGVANLLGDVKKGASPRPTNRSSRSAATWP